MTSLPIRLHTIVCDNSIEYFRYMIDNYRMLASPSAAISIIAHCTDEIAARAVSAQADVVVPVYRYPRYFVVGSINYLPNLMKLMLGKKVLLGSSSGHAAGLNSAFRRSGGGAYDVIADCDTVMVTQDWDRVVADVLSTYGILGATYEPIGGISSGPGPRQTYKDLPNATWVALSPRFDFSRFDASHRLLMRAKIKTAKQSALYNLPIGNELLCDVGWKLPRYLAKRGIPAKSMINVKPPDARARVLAGLDDYHEEFHLDGQPFVVHQRGSHKHAFRSEPLSGPFYAAAEKYLASLAGAPQALSATR